MNNVSPGLPLITVSMGNSRTAIGRFLGNKLEDVFRVSSTEYNSQITTIVNWLDLLKNNSLNEVKPVVLMATVNSTAADNLSQQLNDNNDIQIIWVERDLVIPIGRCLDPEAIVGHDRLLNAAAVFDKYKQACIVIDAGTAVTVDFIDGSGTFHGGAIAPGARMQLEALHKDTSLLPDVELVAPIKDEPWGSNTAAAMLRGVLYGIRGMARYLIEKYSESYGAYPLIIATGGDAHLIFDDDELIEKIVDDLTLYGMEVTFRTTVQQSNVDD